VRYHSFAYIPNSIGLVGHRGCIPSSAGAMRVTATNV
jgi:hypothetical protein